MASKIRFIALAAGLASLLVVLNNVRGMAEEQPVREEYQAQAMGQGTQLGQSFNVTVIIQEYSTPEERQVLVDAFGKAQSQGVYNALTKMKSKGHIAITGTLGYDISFVRKIQTPDGLKIRVLTNRPITFGEAWTDSNSMDYNLSALELDISDQAGKSSGLLLPVCQFVIDKKTNELTIAEYRNPFKLVDVMDRTKH
jgi:hypothetical protein